MMVTSRQHATHFSFKRKMSTLCEYEPGGSTMKSKFVIDIDKIRQSAEQRITEATSDTSRERMHTLLELLNHSLATELLCVARYKSHYYKAMNLGEHVLAKEFLEHAREEQKHADMLAVRIDQLGGEPDFNPENITKRSHSKYLDCKDIASMVRENLLAEHIAVLVYKEIINYIADRDSTTRRMLENILANEEEHIDDLMNFYNRFNLDKDNSEIINLLKEKAQDVGLEMVACEENMALNDADDNPGDKLSSIINKLNRLDTSHHYSSRDFIEKA